MSLFHIIDTLSARLFHTLSKWRGARIFHPSGTLYAGTLTITNHTNLPACTLLNTPATHPIVVRLSRGIGLPPVFPDILGFALRIPNIYGEALHQDILMLTCGGGNVTRHAPLFKYRFFSSFFSTILLYSIGGKKYLFGIIPSENNTKETKSFTLAIAQPLTPWQAIGEIRLEETMSQQASEKIRYNPWNTGGGIKPFGFLQRLRKNTYKASQKGREQREL